MTIGLCKILMKQIRLKQKELECIINAFHHFFPAQDHLWLFGSRVNSHSKGGDIDLYIETDLTDAKEIVDKKMALVNELYRQLGEQKIDVVINMLNSETILPIYQVAKKEGVSLA